MLYISQSQILSSGGRGTGSKLKSIILLLLCNTIIHKESISILDSPICLLWDINCRGSAMNMTSVLTSLAVHSFINYYLLTE